MSRDRVLVTGVSGYVALHVALLLLENGYTVRGTVRGAAREAEVRALLTANAAFPADALEFAHADLTSDEGWLDAAKGCRFVMHVASPITGPGVKDFITPAVDGTLRVLRAAKAAGVERVVVTSSMSACVWGNCGKGRVTAEDWADIQARDIPPYDRSKALAEQAAWEFSRESGLQVATVLPSLVVGPLLAPQFANGSCQVVARMLQGGFPLAVQLTLSYVDARDVAALHLTCMTHPAAAGRRWVASADSLPVMDMVAAIRAAVPDAASKLPTRTLPNFLFPVLSLLEPAARSFRDFVAATVVFDATATQQELGWTPRPAQEAIADCAKSCVAVLKLGK